MNYETGVNTMRGYFNQVVFGVQFAKSLDILIKTSTFLLGTDKYANMHRKPTYNIVNELMNSPHPMVLTCLQYKHKTTKDPGFSFQ